MRERLPNRDRGPHTPVGVARRVRRIPHPDPSGGDADRQRLRVFGNVAPQLHRVGRLELAVGEAKVDRAVGVGDCSEADDLAGQELDPAQLDVLLDIRPYRPPLDTLGLVRVIDPHNVVRAARRHVQVERDGVCHVVRRKLPPDEADTLVAGIGLDLRDAGELADELWVVLHGFTGCEEHEGEKDRTHQGLLWPGDELAGRHLGRENDVLK